MGAVRVRAFKRGYHVRGHSPGASVTPLAAPSARVRMAALLP